MYHVSNFQILARVGVDGYLYPAFLSGYALDEFYEGRQNVDDVAANFRSTIYGLFLWMVLFRVVFYLWCLSVLILISAYHVGPVCENVDCDRVV